MISVVKQVKTRKDHIHAYLVFVDTIITNVMYLATAPKSFLNLMKHSNDRIYRYRRRRFPS